MRTASRNGDSSDPEPGVYGHENANFAYVVQPRVVMPLLKSAKPQGKETFLEHCRRVDGHDTD